ncbi:MAG: sensor histidine kinase [Anaerolineales bacterium]
MAKDLESVQDETSLDLKAQLEETERALRETNLLIEQSQGEVSKLTQRNAAITSHLKQVQGQLDATSVEEIRMAYDSALDAQQRLFVMRGQLEKLQSDKVHLEKYRDLLKSIQEDGDHAASATTPTAKGAFTSVEMLVNAQEAERQRLSRQMHDGPAQALSNFILQTEIAMRLMDLDVDKAREELNSLKASAMSTFQKVRGFIFELRPMMLDDLGLIPTVRRYAEAFKEQAGMEVNLTITGAERRLESYLEVMVFRAIQELMGNAFRHSQASLLKVNLDVSEEQIRVIVDDNGKGFDPDTLQESKSLGLKLIRERVEMLGGTFEIESSAGKGTRVMFFLPIRKS